MKTMFWFPIQPVPGCQTAVFYRMFTYEIDGHSEDGRLGPSKIPGDPGMAVTPAWVANAGQFFVLSVVDTDASGVVVGQASLTYMVEPPPTKAPSPSKKNAKTVTMFGSLSVPPTLQAVPDSTITGCVGYPVVK
jgi:hypothetical protein